MRLVGIERWHLEGASWIRVGPGVYMWAGLRQSVRRQIEAARQRLPDAAVFSGVTAAWLHGIEVLPCDPIEVSVAPAVRLHRRAGMRVRRVALPEADVIEVKGMRATTIVRTLFDACAGLPLVDAVVLADAALHARRVRLAQLVDRATAERGRRGIERFRRAIAFAEPASESAMESRLRMLLVLNGLPSPRAQVSIQDRDGAFAGRLDLYYEQARLGIEYDGSVHRESLAADDRRQNRLLQAGVRLLRFTAGDVLGNPTSVVSQVRAMLAA